MSDEILKRDENFVTVLAGVTDDSDQDVTMLRVDPITKRLLVTATPGSGIIGGTIDATQVAFGTGVDTIGGTDTFVWIDSQKRLGVGTSSPGYQADVSGQATTVSAAVFSGVGLNDATSSGIFVGQVPYTFIVRIENNGFSGSIKYNNLVGIFMIGEQINANNGASGIIQTDDGINITFTDLFTGDWTLAVNFSGAISGATADIGSAGNGSTTDGFGYEINGVYQGGGIPLDTIPTGLGFGAEIEWATITGHTIGDYWTFIGDNPNKISTYAYRIQNASTSTAVTLTVGRGGAADTTYFFPPDDGNSGDVLSTTGGSGGLYWAAPLNYIYIGETVSGGQPNYVLYVDGSSLLAQSSQFQYDDSQGLLQLGTFSNRTGQLSLIDSVAGRDVRITVPALPGSWTLTLPQTSGQATLTPFQYLQTDGLGTTTWAAITVGGIVSLSQNKVWLGNVANTATETGITGSAGLAVFSIDPQFSRTITVGYQGLPIPLDFTGVINILGRTSGTVSITAQPTAGTWTFTLPTSFGSPNQFLQTDGLGLATTWASALVNPMTTLGDTMYDDGSLLNVTRLAGNITSTRKFLRQTGTGAISAAPAWDTILAADIPGSAVTKVDDTNVTMSLSAPAATAALAAYSMTLGWTGTLSRARGGTGAATFVAAGIPEVIATGDLTGQTGAVSVVSITSPNDGVNHTYSVGAYSVITALSAANLTVTLSWTDETGAGRTYDFFAQGLTTSAIGVTGAFPFPPQTIRVQPNTSIGVTTKVTGVSMTYDVGGYICRIS